MKQINFMELALKEAEKAFKKGEVPVGAVIIWGERVLALAHNLREKKKNALCHAEILAINKACKKMRSWRLDGAEMFVTLMPCPMCAGAIVNARLKKVTYAASDESGGTNIFEIIMSGNNLNHKTNFCQDELNSKTAKALLQAFFTAKRNKN